ncbi:MAG TPA: aliphatic sulfonate ABC transporter substrate-binding protein, partial [Polyangiaceae bacterium]
VSRALLARIERIAPSDAPVLITGETGTGKELVARQVHALSRRSARPFVAVNAGAFSENLAESELFGHEKGAFTGAHGAKAGWFETAHGGTLFLDEIGDLPMQLQVKLLRVLQEGEVTRVGSRTSTSIDVRLIAATNVDLRAAIAAGQFRQDLFYRLKVSSLSLPPLRDRPGDIPALAQHFLDRYARKLGRHGIEIGERAQECLIAHRWPGNIRELENAIHHALLVCQGPEIEPADLQLDPGHSKAIASARTEASVASELSNLEEALIALLKLETPNLHQRVEAKLLAATYRHCNHNQLETARRLGLSRNVVRARLIEHGELQGPLRRTSASIAPISGSLKRGGSGAIRIGYQKLGLLMLVKAYGAFDAALAARGQSVSWVEYDGGIQIVGALRASELDMGIVGNCPAVFAQAEDVPIVYVAAEPPAPRGAALLVPERSQVRTVGELRGKRVAVNRAAQAHYLLLKALDEAGVDVSELEICFESPQRALRAFQAGAIDAWAIWDPWLSSARLDFGARVLRDASGLLNNSAYYVARRDFAERSGDLVEELLTQLQMAAHWAKKDPSRAADLLAPGLGFSSRALIASLDRELRPVPVSADLITAQQDVADTLLRMQLIPRAVSVVDAQWRLRPTG